MVFCTIIGMGCGDNDVEKKPYDLGTEHIHTYIKHEYKDPTCENDGNVEYFTCDCNGVFILQDSLYKKVLIDDVRINRLGHNIVIDDAVGATCVCKGLTEGSHCSICGKIFKEQEVIDAKGHSLICESKEELPHFQYVICDRCGEISEYYLPSINITCTNNLTSEYANCQIYTSNCLAKHEISNTKAQIKIRGNWTATLSKKPFRIKFDKKENLFGLNDGLKAKSWVLLADYADKSMVRNAIGFYLAKEIYGDEYYSSDCCFVEVYVNEDYQGVYLLAEQQQINKGRIDIFEDKNRTSTDIGYLIEYDQYYYKEEPDIVFEINYDEIPYFNDAIADDSHFIKYYVIKNDISDPSQKVFIQDRIQKIWDVVYDALYADHSDLSSNPYKTINENGDIVYDELITGKYEALNLIIDVNSLVDTYLFNEIVQDMDIGFSSFYVSLDMSEKGNKKLTFQAPWDFDWCFANSVNNTEQLYIGNYLEDEPGHDKSNPWLLLVSNESWFWSLMQDKWQDLLHSGVQNNIIKLITDFTDNYDDFANAEYIKWPEKAELLVWCSSKNTLSAQNQAADAENVLQYINQRFYWLDYYFSDLNRINFAH